MNHNQDHKRPKVFDVFNARGQSRIVLVCEHASRHIPPEFHDLGATPAALESHVAWDPGAKHVAETMARQLDAPLVSSCVSRLVFDSNRPADAHDAMPEKSEKYNIPGNANLTTDQRNARVAAYYEPFRAAVASTLDARAAPILVTVHSFTPVYHGQTRSVEIGVLHDKDQRLADAMLTRAREFVEHDVRRNQPYGPSDGVTHTLQQHAIPDARLNVMIEIRNDLVETPPLQNKMALALARWVAAAVSLAEATA